MNIIKKIHLAYRHPVLNYRKEEYKLYPCENNSRKIIWLNEKDFKKLKKYFEKKFKKACVVFSFENNPVFIDNKIKKVIVSNYK